MQQPWQWWLNDQVRAVLCYVIVERKKVIESPVTYYLSNIGL